MGNYVWVVTTCGDFYPARITTRLFSWCHMHIIDVKLFIENHTDCFIQLVPTEHCSWKFTTNIFKNLKWLISKLLKFLTNVSFVITNKGNFCEENLSYYCCTLINLSVVTVDTMGLLVKISFLSFPSVVLTR